MADDEHLTKLKEGVEAWNQWRKHNSSVKPDLSGADFKSREAVGELLWDEERERVNLSWANLIAANLSGATLSGADLTEAYLSRAHLTGVNLNMANLTEADLREADLEGTDLFNANLTEADLTEANLKMANLNMANLTEAILREANLEGAELNMADFSEVNLSEANLNGANLSRAELAGADLTGAYFIGANLSGTNLRGSDLTGADLSGANLTGADLTGADLGAANLTNANLSAGNLGDTNVRGVIFSRSSRQRNFHGIRAATCHGSQMFKTFAQDQDFIEEFRSKGGWRASVFWVWWLFADCGRSIWRWVFWSVLFAAAFAVVFYYMGESHFHFAHIHPSIISTIYYSVVTFTTLGFGDIIPKTEIAAMAVMAEVILGYIMLGGLISILANKLARRA